MAYKEVTREQYLAALRSGDYLQTTGATFRAKNAYTPECFCALGVLDEIAGVPRLTYAYHDIPESELYDFVPEEVAIKLGLSPALVKDIEQWNDWEGLNFSEIADRLEETWNEQPTT